MVSNGSTPEISKSEVFSMQQRRSGFTLVEILVVISIIAILAAILLPVFRGAQERAAQANCASNLQQIGMAVKSYYADNKRYPASLAVILPATAQLNTVTAITAPNPVGVATPAPNTEGSSDLNSLNVLACPDDPTDVAVPRSSYGDTSNDLNTAIAGTTAPPEDDYGRYVWNYWGYKSDPAGEAGFAYRTATEAETAANAAVVGGKRWRLVNPDPPAAYSHRNAAGYVPGSPDNVIKYSLSNRFAPGNTIITHCIWHRMPTSNLAKPTDIYDPAFAGDATGARDIVLRLDGGAKSVDVTQWRGAGPENPWLDQSKP